MRDIDVPLVSPSLATSESLQRATKFVARNTQIFFGGNRNISFLRDMQINRGTCRSLVTRMFSHHGRHAARDRSPSLAIA